MTGAASSGVTDEVYQRLMSRLPELSSEVIRRIVAEVPQYASLPTEELAGDIVRIIERSIVLFATYVVGGRLPGDEELAELRASAALRAEEGISIDAVVGVYHMAAGVVWDEVMDGVDDAQAVRDVHDRVMRFLQAVVPVVAAGYVDSRITVLGEEHDDRQLLLTSLLEGSETPVLGSSHSGLAASYVVLSLRIGAHPDEEAAQVDADVAARRKVRRLRATAEHYARGPVLSTLDSRGGLLLIPQRKPAAEMGEEIWPELEQLTRRMAKAAGADVTAGAAVAEPAAVADAAKLAREVLDVVVALGRPEGLYRLEDVLFEYQLTRPGPARDGLVAVLDPLRDKVDLLETLDVYLAHGGSRRDAAAALHVHPNTVDYRLAKVSELTGVDPAQAHGVRLLAAAVAAKAVVDG
jgi:hypothetical protein